MQRRYSPLKEKWIQIIGLSILGGITLGIFIDLYLSPVVEIAQAETVATTTPQEIKVLLVLDYSNPKDIEQLIRQTFPEEPNTAVAVAKAESELNTKAFNPEAHRGCMGSVGVFQIACVHNRSNPNALKDVEFNIKKARAIYDETKARTGNGWLKWGAYTDGRYKSHL